MPSVAAKISLNPFQEMMDIIRDFMDLSKVILGFKFSLTLPYLLVIARFVRRRFVYLMNWRTPDFRIAGALESNDLSLTKSD